MTIDIEEYKRLAASGKPIPHIQMIFNLLAEVERLTAQLEAATVACTCQGRGAETLKDLREAVKLAGKANDAHQRLVAHRVGKHMKLTRQTEEQGRIRDLELWMAVVQTNTAFAAHIAKHNLGDKT